MSIRATAAYVDLGVLKNNIKKIKLFAAKTKTCLVVKANAYGHGITQISSVAASAGVDALSVATVDEGVMIREMGVTLPIIVLFQHSKGESEAVCHYNLTPVISSDATIPYYEDYCKRHNRKMKVHIKVDTGLSRMGVFLEEVSDFAKSILRYKHIEIEGVSTHLAAADSDEEKLLNYTKEQIDKFMTALKLLEKNKIKVKICHASNSASTLSKAAVHFNMIRFGLAAYGYSPNKNNNIDLHPALSLRSKVLVIKNIKSGTAASYGATWKAKKDTTLAVIPIGYADGLSRSFSNKGKVKIKDKYYNIVGRVCMDQTIIEIGKNSGIEIEDDVLIYGDDSVLNAQTLARTINTIPYEILTSITERVPRVYIE